MNAVRYLVAPLALTPIVVAALVAAALVRPDWQAFVLLAASVLWIAVASQVALPRDADEAPVALRWLAGRLGVRRAVLVAGVALALVVGLPLTVGPLRERLHGWGGESWIGVAFKLGLILYAAAVILRIVRAFSASASGVGLRAAWPAALAAGAWPVVAILLLDRFRDAIGEDLSEHFSLAVLWIAAGPIVVVVAWLVARVVGSRLRASRDGERGRRLAAATEPAGEAQVRQVRNALAIASVSLAVASSLLALGAGFGVLVDRKGVETSDIAAPGRADVAPPARLEHDAGWLASAAGQAAAMRIARFYRPVLRMVRGDWLPGDAADYLRDATDGCEPPEREHVGSCENERSNLPAAARGPRVPARGVETTRAHAYPRVVAVTPAAGAEGPEAATAFVVQYWLFYPYNDWRAESAVGHFAQEHEADWEFVAVGLDAETTPTFVAYSAHCGGTWRRWTDAPVVSLDQRAEGAPRIVVGSPTAEDDQASHPLVAVASGSHGNYATVGEREPDWASCSFDGVASQLFSLLSFAANLKERTAGSGAFAVPRLAPSAVTDSFARRPEWWGPDGWMTLGGFGLGRDEHGPDALSTGAHTAPWKRPLAEYFHDGDWHEERSAAPPPRPEADTSP